MNVKICSGSEETMLRKVVEENNKMTLTVDELAFRCHMSLSSFKRHFLKVYSCGPKKYLMKQRMALAKELLLLKKRPSVIYADLGYQSLSSFSTEFRKFHRLSPKQFQQTTRMSEVDHVI